MTSRRIIVGVLGSLGLAIDSLAYNVSVHVNISEAAFSVSNLTEQPSILSNLGVTATSQFPNSAKVPKTVLTLIKDGAAFEDDFPRPLNHFFDPISGAALSVLGAQPLYNYTSPDWALEDTAEVTPGWQQDFSYRDANSYLYRALTLPANVNRDTNFGLLFETLGHVIHHVQDMAQPQHVRNDAHLDADLPSWQEALWCLIPVANNYCVAYRAIKNPSAYETYTKDHVNKLKYDGYAPVYPGPRLALDDPVGSPFRVPRDFWKTYPYSAGLHAGKGIAEFTNSNFVSAGTNFNSGKYALPAFDPSKKTDVDIQQLCQENPPCPPLVGTMTMYGTDVIDRLAGPPISNPRASTYSVFDADLTKKGRNPTFTLNRFNYEAAQYLLVQRAVGYSAGLINYFFRGLIDLVNDPDDSSSYRVANWGPEALAGTFALYYDAKDGQRKAVANAKWTLNIAAAAPNATNPSLSAAVTFAPPLDASVPGKYVLVFNGDQGQEKPANGSLGAVIGKIATVQHLAGLYVAGLDAQGQLVYLRVDRGGTHILSQSDFNPLEKASLPSLPSDTPFPGYVSKVYKFKQVKFGTDATGGPGYSVVALALNDIPDPTAVGVWRINDTMTYDATTRSYSYVNGAAWRAISPDPTIGRFLFSVVDPFGPLSYVRSWTDAKGQSQYAVGAISLPAPTGGSVVSYWGFHDGTLFISPDGLTISGLESEMPSTSTTAGTVTTSTITRKRGSVRITLGAVPSATLVEDPYIYASSQQDTNSLSTVPIGTDGLSPPNGCVDPDAPLTFVVSQATYSKKVNDTFTTGTSVGYFNGTLSTYFYSERFDWSDTTDQVFDLGGVGLKPPCCLPTNGWVKTNERGAWVTDDKRVATLQFEDGAIPVWTTSKHRIEDYTRQYEGCYSGLPPYPPIGGSSSYFEQVVTRALTGKAADAITNSRNSPADTYRWHFRGIDITGHSYAADASPLGEVFFALSDGSVVIHEPLTGRMPKIQIPTNVVKLIAALWM